MQTSHKPERLWFLNTLVTVRIAAGDGANGMSVLEHLAPMGDSPPLHVHRTEDEIFHVISGELRCVVGEKEISLSAGEDSGTWRTPACVLGVPKWPSYTDSRTVSCC